jgi:hypothetical protein
MHRHGLLDNIMKSRSIDRLESMLIEHWEYVVDLTQKIDREQHGQVGFDDNTEHRSRQVCIMKQTFVRIVGRVLEAKAIARDVPVTVKQRKIILVKVLTNKENIMSILIQFYLSASAC